MQTIKKLFDKFWAWYERYYALNVTIAAVLFTLQIMHLLWLYTDVISVRLGGDAVFHFHEGWLSFIIFIDYLEIPAIITTSLVYINGLRKGYNFRDFLYLILINSQWIHLLWITDEFVVEALAEGHETILPTWLAWVAILIDYLELPVIYATIKEALIAYKKEGIKGSLIAIKEGD
jgi:hypothetical protein